jgi:transposase
MHEILPKEIGRGGGDRTRSASRLYCAPMGANSLCRAKGYFGEFFRRMRAKLGTAQAITATAHKIARILYHVLLTKERYAETVFHRCDEQAQRRAEMRLRKQAAHLGFQLLPITTTGE